MSNYKPLSNLSPEDIQRLTDVVNSEGEGILLVQKAGVLVTPVSPALNFTGSGVTAASVDGVTTVDIPGGGGTGVTISASEWSPTGMQAVPAGATTVLNMFINEDFQDDTDWSTNNTNTLTCNRAGAGNRYKFTFQWTFIRSNAVTDEDGLLRLLVNGTPVRGTVWSNYGPVGALEAATFHMTVTAVVALNDTIQTNITTTAISFNFESLGSFVLIERMN